MNADLLAWALQKYRVLAAAGDTRGAMIAYNEVLKLSEKAVIRGGVPVVEEMAWQVGQKWAVYQVGSRLGIRQYISQLVRTLGTVAGVDAVETGAVGAAGRAIGGKMLGWPMMLATIVVSLGCASQDVKDQAQSRAQSWDLYNQYLIRYMRAAIGWRHQHPAMMVSPPNTFEEFLSSQNMIKLP